MEGKEVKVLKGKKLNMSQVFRNDGTVIPVTILEVKDAEIDEGLENQPVIISGRSKGKGFTGAMKRWGFAGGPATRGQSNKPRAPGAIGAQTPGRVFKGKKMAGRKGNKKVTVKGLKIVKVIPKEKKIMISGPVPGARNSAVTMQLL